uniref:Uncharacterized protein n=1 Tax=Ciona intestinalis TaxID=7719 RepID=H2XLC3_CIOIN
MMLTLLVFCDIRLRSRLTRCKPGHACTSVTIWTTLKQNCGKNGNELVHQLLIYSTRIMFFYCLQCLILTNQGIYTRRMRNSTPYKYISQNKYVTTPYNRI